MSVRYDQTPATVVFFFFNHTSTPEIYTLSLHDDLPILAESDSSSKKARGWTTGNLKIDALIKQRDRKSTRLNSSHTVISYAVFCLKKKKKTDPKLLSRSFC